MAGTIVKIKQSSVAGRLPTAGSLTQGELALNTNDKKLYSKDGSGTVFEIGASSGISKANEIFTTEFVATASQTSFAVEYNSVNDYVNVYFNGVWLPPTDFTATSGSAVVLDTGAPVGTEVVIQVIKALNLANGSEITEHEFTATASQTSFTITGGYDGVSSDVEVYVNGVKLRISDFTSSSGTVVVLGTAATVNDEVTIRVIKLAVLATSSVQKTTDNGSAILPAGTTAQRDTSPAGGYLRWNTTLNRSEVYNDNTSAWQDVGQQTLTTEQVQDAIGPMLSGNTESGITVAYDDANNQIDFTVTSQTDENFTTADHAKLDGIETAATADQTAAQIKTAYESNSDTNEFSDAEQTKLSNIEASATADQTAAQIKTLYEGETSAFTDAQFTKLGNIETAATADQTAAQIKTAYESNADTYVLNTAKNTKLAGIETSADVTDTANVTAAGALMDSELAGIAAIKATTGTFLTADQTKLDTIETSATADQTDAEIRTAVEAATDSNVFTDADHTKLNAIEASATADQTGAQIKTLYEAETNAFTDAKNTKLSGIETSATADQTAAQIKTAYEGETSAFTDAQFTKLGNIEAAADVTDVTNVTAAGALMDSELAGLAAVKATTGTFLTADQTKLDTIETSADVTDTANVVAALSAGTGVSISGAGVVAVTAVALTTVQTAASQAAQLALTAQEGDVVVRSDQNKSYVHNSGSAGTMADYTLLATPTDAVLSVNGNTGAITAAQIAAAVEAASGSNTFTDADHTKLNAISGTNTGDQTTVSGSAGSFTGSLAGDVTGTQGATVVGNDSHTHTTSTIAGLSGTNTGDQTSVSGSAGSFTGSLAGDVTGTQGATVVGNDSHTHTTSTITNLSGTNTGDNTVSTSGAATTATKLLTSRTIAGVSFDGTANISLNNNAITNGAGYTNDQTAAELLVKIKTVDVNGTSGINAGTIDGIPSDRITYGNNASGTNEGNVSDWNSPTKSGFYSHSGASNRWSGASNWSSILHHKLYTSNNSYASQLGFDTYSNNVYHRTNNNGTWTSWDKSWTDGNDGSGSGLDADLLDGQHGSYYSVAHSHPYLPLAGGTMTGNLILDGTTARLYDTDTYPLVQVNGGKAYLGSTSRATTVLASSSNIKHNRAGTEYDIWTAYNDGAGSGLDADKLDGQQGSYYSPTTHTHSYLPLAGGTLTGALTVDQGTSSTLEVICDDGGTSLIRARGTGQGTGAFEVGQSTTHGGGMSYNGDASPTWATGETADWITFYALNANVRTEVFGYSYASTGAVTFNGALTWSGGGSANANTAYGWGNHASAGYITSQRGISNSVSSTSSTISASSAAVKSAYDRSWPNTTYNFGGTTFTSRNSGNVIAIDSVTSNMVGYVNGSTAAGYSDGAGFSAAYSSSWVGQIFVDFRTGKVSSRGKNNGTWQAHRFMWDNLNDGAGSGLDADLLDGVQGSGYALSSHTHDDRYYTEDESSRSLARLAGWEPSYSNSDQATVYWDKSQEAVVLDDTGDGATGMAFKAFKMKAGETVDFQVMIKGDSASSTGTYLRSAFLNGDLPDGKTHVSGSGGSSYVNGYTTQDAGWYENSAITTSWVNHERSFTATTDGYCSIVILNWTGYTGITYVKQPNIKITAPRVLIYNSAGSLIN